MASTRERAGKGKASAEHNRLPYDSAVLPRQLRSGDNDRHRGGPGRIRGGGKHLRAGVESVALRADRTAKELKAPRLKAELISAYSYSGMVRVCDHVVYWGGFSFWNFPFSFS